MSKSKNVSHKNIEALILIMVVGIALIGIWAMYRASTGKAFFPDYTPQFIVKETHLGFCCCKTAKGHLFEVYGNLESETDIDARKQACNNVCDEHGSQTHPVTSYGVGRCGAHPNA